MLRWVISEYLLLEIDWLESQIWMYRVLAYNIKLKKIKEVYE